MVNKKLTQKVYKPEGGNISNDENKKHRHDADSAR